MTRTEVRRVVPAEWQALRDTRLAALADAPQAFITTYEQAAAYPEEQWRSRAAEGGTLLAWRSGSPVGIVGGFVHEGVPEIVAMWVAPEARGTGAVEALLDGAVAWAQEQPDADEVRLWVVEGNERARRSYERYGFLATGRAMSVPGRPGEAEVEMSYSLRR